MLGGGVVEVPAGLVASALAEARRREETELDRQRFLPSPVRTARSSLFFRVESPGISANPKVIGPTRPMNISAMMTHFERGSKSAVIPREIPTVPRADAASNRMSSKGLSSKGIVSQLQ